MYTDCPSFCIMSLSLVHHYCSKDTQYEYRKKTAANFHSRTCATFFHWFVATIFFAATHSFVAITFPKCNLSKWGNKGWVKVRKVYAKRQTDVILRPPTPRLLSVKISVKISMLLEIRETCMPLKASMLLHPHPLNVTLTLSVHFSNFDSPLIRVVLPE